MARKAIKNIDLKGKKVLVHVDFNVPLESGVIANDNRIVATLPTIKYVIGNGGKAIPFSHLSHVKTEEDGTGKSLKPVAGRLSESLGQPVTFIPETRDKELENAVNNMKDGDILIFESTCFEDVNGKEESGNDAELGKYWASLDDVFVNDAFGAAHRTHASNVGIASTGIPTVAGFLMEKEVKFVGEAVEDPERPFIVILDDAEISDKVAVIENLIEEADKILVGDGMTHTFMKAQGYNADLSSLEEDKVGLAKGLMEKASGRLVLSVGIIVSKEFSNGAPFHTVPSTEIPDDEENLDIGEKTIELFANELQDAKTVVWNGPVGVFGMSNFARGTIGVCEAIASLEDATTIIGNGDSAAVTIRLGYEDKFSHILTGGGASLELLEDKTLPDLASINDK